MHTVCVGILGSRLGIHFLDSRGHTSDSDLQFASWKCLFQPEKVFSIFSIVRDTPECLTGSSGKVIYHISDWTSRYPGHFHNVSEDQLHAVKAASLSCSGSFGQLCFIHTAGAPWAGGRGQPGHTGAPQLHTAAPVVPQAPAALAERFLSIHPGHRMKVGIYTKNPQVYCGPM